MGPQSLATEPNESLALRISKSCLYERGFCPSLRSVDANRPTLIVGSPLRHLKISLKGLGRQTVL